MVLSRKPYLGLTVFLVLLKDWERSMAPRFYLLVSDAYQGNEDVG